MGQAYKACESAGDQYARRLTYVVSTEYKSPKLDADGNTLMSRPLCLYPEVAVYDGTGDMNDARSFSCGLPGDRPQSE